MVRALEIETTVYETLYHWRRFIQDSYPNLEHEVVGERRVFQVRCEAILIDLRAAVEPRLVDRNDYSYLPARTLSLAARASGLLAPSARGLALAPRFSGPRRCRRSATFASSPIACEVTRDGRAIARRAVARDYHSRMKPDHLVAFKPETATLTPGSVCSPRAASVSLREWRHRLRAGRGGLRQGTEARLAPAQIVIVPHENMGVAMAHGYAMVTGRPQAMMVHVGVGTANSLNGLINLLDADPFAAGRTPITESGAVPAARNNYIHWAQSTSTKAECCGSS